MVGNIDSKTKSVQKELSEKQKITKVHDQDSSIVLKASPALLLVHQRKGSDGNNTTHNHLQDLCYCDPLGAEPLWFHLDAHQKVIKVHDGMNSIVDSGVDDSSWRMCDHGMPSTKEDRGMMVPV